MNPLTLLRLEWQKFGPNMTFRVLCILYAVFFLLATLLVFLIGDKIDFSANGQSMRPFDDLLTFPRSWELVAYIGSWMNVMLFGFIGVFMITLELGCRTLRQGIISGLSRTDVFVAKAMGLLALAGAATLLYLIVGGFAGMLTGGGEAGSVMPAPGVVGGFYVQCLGYGLLGTLIGLFIRQTALATLAYFAYVLFVEGIFRWLLYLMVLKHKVLFFMPDNVLESLASFPVPEMAQQLTEQQEFIKALSPVELWVSAAVYIGLFAGVLFWRLRKADL